MTTIIRKASLRMALLAILTMTTANVASAQTEEPMTRQADGIYVVNTTTLCQTGGYRGTTPLKVYIKGGKVVRIEALRNQETPKYFKLVKDGLLGKWDGLKVAKAQKLQVDGVTGATFSSRAVKENVRAALEYYQKAIRK